MSWCGWVRSRTNQPQQVREIVESVFKHEREQHRLRRGERHCGGRISVVFLDGSVRDPGSLRMASTSTNLIKPLLFINWI